MTSIKELREKHQELYLEWLDQLEKKHLACNYNRVPQLAEAAKNLEVSSKLVMVAEAERFKLRKPILLYQKSLYITTPSLAC
jgi:hypothetical protein